MSQVVISKKNGFYLSFEAIEFMAKQNNQEALDALENYNYEIETGTNSKCKESFSSIGFLVFP